jgi:hypothetical protein
MMCQIPQGRSFPELSSASASLKHCTSVHSAGASHEEINLREVWYFIFLLSLSIHTLLLLLPLISLNLPTFIDISVTVIRLIGYDQSRNDCLST